MRPKERIHNFLNLVDYDILEERWNIRIPEELRLTINSELVWYWLEWPDLRFGQMLINQGYLPDQMNIWNDEEYNILHDQGTPIREFLLWGKNYNEFKQKLKKTEWVLLKDMTTSHIENILLDVKNGKYQIPIDYMNAFEEELNFRIEHAKVNNYGINC